MLKDIVASKIKLPSSKGIIIDYISDKDATLNILFEICSPAKLEKLSVNWSSDSNEWINIDYYIHSLPVVIRAVTKDILLASFNINSADLRHIIRAASQAQRVAFHFCSIHCSEDLDLWSEEEYKIEFISFQGWGDTNFEEITTDWKVDPSWFESIVKAISNCGLRDSLKKVSIILNDTLLTEKVQELFNSRDMSQITVVEEYLDLFQNK